MEYVMIENLNTKPELGINFNDLPAGSYIIKDGKLLPNLDDAAMLERSNVKGQKSDETSETVSPLTSDVLPAEDADCSDA